MRCAGDVAKYSAAISMHSLDNLARMAQAGDDDRHAMFDHDLQIGLKPGIGPVNDQVDTMGRHKRLRVVCTIPDQLVFNQGQPLVKLFSAAGIDMGKSTHHTGLALRQNQRRKRDQEHR